MLADAQLLNPLRRRRDPSPAPSARVQRHRKRRGDAASPGMAAPAKRARARSPVTAASPVLRAAPAPLPLPNPGRGHVTCFSPLAAGPSGGEPDSDAVAGFLRWCAGVGLELSPKVAVSRQGTVAGYGMVARESVQPGELLFAVPRSVLLSPHTCSISGLLERGG